MKRTIYAKWANFHINCIAQTVPSICGGCCGNCKFLDRKTGCTLTPDEKPVGCHLYPFILDGKGNISKRAGGLGRCKGNYNSGEKTLIENLYSNFENLFGKEQTELAIEAIKRGEDFTFETSDEFEERLLNQRDFGVWHGFTITNKMLGL